MSNKLYGERDAIKQGSYYIRHVEAMTAEHLHSKADIAAELAHRDILLATKQADLDRALLALTEAQELNGQWRLDWKASQASLTSTNERLREARPYMQHMVGCDFRSCEGPCTCGLNTWLAGSAPGGQS